jgi:hypothetical protein
MPCAGRLVGGGAPDPSGTTLPEIAHVAPRLADVRTLGGGVMFGATPTQNAR